MNPHFSRSRFPIALFLSFLIVAGCSKNDNIPVGPGTVVPNDATVRLDSMGQRIRGFGGVSMPDWIPDLTTAQVHEAFGAGNGQIGLTILRVRVPYDETQFSLEVPTAALAYSLGATIFASPWTPPDSMKTNHNIVGGALKTSSYASYASHLKAFADYLSSNNAPLYAISIQNEPDASVNYESCYWSAAQMLNFVKNNASAIGLKIIMPESENFNHALSDPTLNDAGAAANVSIIGGHLYGGGLAAYPLAMSKGKEVWMTEHLDTDTSWTAVIGTAKEINDCMKAGMNAYVWWYIRRFYGLIDENGNITKRGYVMSQYARFVRPGYTLVEASGGTGSNVDITAYRNGSSIVIVLVNRNAYTIYQTISVPNSTATSFSCYTTSPAKNCSQEGNVSGSSGTFTTLLDPSSVTTLVSN